MCAHHLILGELEDFITGETLPDTHDERYRQKLERLMVREKGFRPEELRPRLPLELKVDEKRSVVTVDLVVQISGRACMVLVYGPGSLVSRHRPALGMARLVAPYQVPVVVVTNGEDADVLEGATGKQRGSGFGAISTRAEMETVMAHFDFAPVAAERAEIESRIVFAYEIECSCSPSR
jgi:hypothetical protein